MITSLPEATEVLADRYSLLEVLGEGGMATVYRAFDHHHGVQRAIKVVHPSLVTPKVRRRLAQEGQLMARLTHPNIVRLFELGEHGDSLFLVLELVEGGSVADRTAQDGPLPPRMAAKVEIGLLAALDFAHANGVVHRDVKPHNVLLDLDGTVRVTDFGIARWEEVSLTRTGAVLGTFAYMPPEQKTSSRTVDPRADLYAAGATLFAMVTGNDPHDLFAAGFDSEMAGERLAHVPSELAAWILRATRFRPEDRFPDAASMSAELLDIVRLLPPDPPGPPLIDPRRASRSPRVPARQVQWSATMSGGLAGGGEVDGSVSGMDPRPSTARRDAARPAGSGSSQQTTGGYERSHPKLHWLTLALVVAWVLGLVLVFALVAVASRSGALSL